MNELKNFNFEGNQVRTIMVNEEPCFVGRDVAVILGYTNPMKAIRDHVDEEDVTVNESFTVHGTAVKFINESGLYSLILKSKKPEAKRFKRWVTSEVLPTIRKHGAYMTPETIEQALLNPDTFLKLAERLRDEHQGRLFAEQQVQELKPKADYCDTVLNSKSLLTATDLAKDYGMSAIAFNRLLHELRIQYRGSTTWHLFSEYQDRGWTHSSEVNANGGIRHTTKWTQKGKKELGELLETYGIFRTEI